MSHSLAEAKAQPFARAKLLGLVILGLAVFCFLFALVDSAYFRFADARFPHVGASAWLATLWGVVSRAHLLVLIIPLVLWRPRQFGFQTGKIQQHWRMLLVMLLANCGVIAAYLWLTGSSTPYSGNQWLVTEIITVPVVEEAFWRGLVFSALLLALRGLYPEGASTHWAVWLCGLAFGLLHVKNVVAGVPLAFAAIQALNATIWGVVYGYARAKTESIYPPMLLHAAMNLVVILF
ncbi:MAG: CPBP family intramembrane metalloprotease [Chloroflexi bacterium]|nr:CPBP family intramembrane metalloprotease [Chloroflexota bacterium]